MKMINMAEAMVIGGFSILFAGYALFVYPLEKARDLANPVARKNRAKYAPNLT